MTWDFFIILAAVAAGFYARELRDFIRRWLTSWWQKKCTHLDYDKGCSHCSTPFYKVDSLKDCIYRYTPHCCPFKEEK